MLEPLRSLVKNVYLEDLIGRLKSELKRRTSNDDVSLEEFRLKYLTPTQDVSALIGTLGPTPEASRTKTQAVALRECATHRGFVIINEYRDDGINGSKDSRPALDRLIRPKLP